MTLINHRITHGGCALIKLGIYVECINSTYCNEFLLKPIVILELTRDDTCCAGTVSRAKTTTPKDLNIGQL